MKDILKWLPALAALGLLGMLLWDVPELPQPLSRGPVPVSPAPELKPEVQQGPMDGIWVQRPSPPAAKVITPPIQALPPSMKVSDKNSLQFLGQFQTALGGREYLFKIRATGRILRLSEESAGSEWELKSASPQLFVIEGPGGIYEVVR